MNAVHKTYVTLECDGKRYTIVAQVENFNSAPEDQVFWAHGQDHLDPVLSVTGWGESVEEAVKDFLGCKFT